MENGERTLVRRLWDALPRIYVWLRHSQALWERGRETMERNTRPHNFHLIAIVLSGTCLLSFHDLKVKYCEDPGAVGFHLCVPPTIVTGTVCPPGARRSSKYRYTNWCIPHSRPSRGHWHASHLKRQQAGAPAVQRRARVPQLIARCRCGRIPILS